MHREAHLVAAPHALEHNAIAVEDGDGPLGQLERTSEGRLAQLVHQLLAKLPLVVGCAGTWRHAWAFGGAAPAPHMPARPPQRTVGANPVSARRVLVVLTVLLDANHKVANGFSPPVRDKPRRELQRGRHQLDIRRLLGLRRRLDHVAAHLAAAGVGL